jgi:hypothetical protein
MAKHIKHCINMLKTFFLLTIPPKNRASPGAVISKTKADEVRTHAVSPELITGGGVVPITFSLLFIIG